MYPNGKLWGCNRTRQVFIRMSVLDVKDAADPNEMY